jgi:hypothetical protein
MWYAFCVLFWVSTAMQLETDGSKEYSAPIFRNQKQVEIVISCAGFFARFSLLNPEDGGEIFRPKRRDSLFTTRRSRIRSFNIKKIKKQYRSRYSGWLRDARPKDQSLNPGRVNIFASTYIRDRLWGTPNLLPDGIRGALSPGVKRQGREASHSLPTSAEVKNTWIYAPIPPRLSTGTDLPFKSDSRCE